MQFWGSRKSLAGGCWCLLLSGLWIGPVQAEPWSVFQNAGRVSVANSSQTDQTAEPNWSEPTVRWNIPLNGYGQSSPILWNGQIYVTTVTGPNKETCLLTAYRSRDGEQLWQREWSNPQPQESNNYVSRAAPSPVADEAGVVCFFEGGLLAACTHAGEIRWERNLVEEYGPVAERHGLSASLEQDAKRVFVWVERANEPYVLAVEKSNGKNQWKSPGLGVTSWASPRLIPAGEQTHLVLSGIGRLTGLDPESGQQLWTFTDIVGNSTPTPMPAGDGQFLIGATVGREGGDAGRAAQSNGLIRISRTEQGDWQAGYVWQAQRATSSFGSPVVCQQMAYYVNRSGVVYGLQLDTGKELFAERLAGSSWATPLVLEETVLFFSKEGTLNAVAAGETFEPRGQYTFWADQPQGAERTAPEGNPAAATPPAVLYAVAWDGQQLYVRSGNQLTALTWP